MKPGFPLPQTVGETSPGWNPSQEQCQIHRISQGYAINPYYEDKEIDYLFSLVEGEAIEGTINQYKIPRLLWDAIFRHQSRIQKERPLLGRKIEGIQSMTLQESFTIDPEAGK